MQQITIGSNQAGQRFDKFLHKYLPNAGSGFLYKMLRKKNIVLNGGKADGKEILAVGDEVKTFFSDETFAMLSGKSADTDSNVDVSEYTKAYEAIKGVKVLYEDDNVLILNKPAGVLTQKAEGNDLSLNEYLIGYLLHSGAITANELATFHPSVCNRLDRNTSGIVLCGKSLAGSQALSASIKDRSVRKFYYTVCRGKITGSVHLKGYLLKDERTNTVKISRSEIPGSSPIQTIYKPVKSNERFTMLEVELITGKTHQIRAHLSSDGHPILGDRKYGNASGDDFGLKYQLLHAARIEFPACEGVLSPLSGKTIEAELPQTFQNVLHKAGLND